MGQEASFWVTAPCLKGQKATPSFFCGEPCLKGPRGLLEAIWLWVKNRYPKWLALQVETWTKTCGPIPGRSILTHTLLFSFGGGGVSKLWQAPKADPAWWSFFEDRAGAEGQGKNFLNPTEWRLGRDGPWRSFCGDGPEMGQGWGRGRPGGGGMGLLA